MHSRTPYCLCCCDGSSLSQCMTRSPHGNAACITLWRIIIIARRRCTLGGPRPTHCACALCTVHFTQWDPPWCSAPCSWTGWWSAPQTSPSLEGPVGGGEYIMRWQERQMCGRQGGREEEPQIHHHWLQAAQAGLARLSSRHSPATCDRLGCSMCVWDAARAACSSVPSRPADQGVRPWRCAPATGPSLWT